MKAIKTTCAALIATSALTMAHAKQPESISTGFNFVDCKGKHFNTKKIKDSDKSDKQTDCYITGILNTKFDVDHTGKNFKSVKQMTTEERDLFATLSAANDQKGLFAVSVYDVAMTTEEFKHLVAEK